jgi:hypothetical protein
VPPKDAPAAVDPKVLAQLTFGDVRLAKTHFALQGLIGLLTKEIDAPRTKVWTIPADDLRSEWSIACHKVELARQLLGVRLREQLLDVVDSINRTRTLSLAQTVRAAVETAGAIVYYRKKFTDCESDSAALTKQLNKCLLGGRFNWSEWEPLFFSGSEDALAEFTRRVAREKGSIGEEGPPSVMTFIDYLEKRWVEQAMDKGRHTLPSAGHVRVLYNQLCDFVHPSVGTWKTYVDTDADSLEVRVSSESLMESLQFVWLCFGQYVTELCFIAYFDLLEMGGLQERHGSARGPPDSKDRRSEP